VLEAEVILHPEKKSFDLKLDGDESTTFFEDVRIPY